MWGHRPRVARGALAGLCDTIPLGLADLAGLSDVIPVGIGCFPVRRMSKHQALSSLGGGEGEASAVLGVLYARNSSVISAAAIAGKPLANPIPGTDVLGRLRAGYPANLAVCDMQRKSHAVAGQADCARE